LPPSRPRGRLLTGDVPLWRLRPIRIRTRDGEPSRRFVVDEHGVVVQEAEGDHDDFCARAGRDHTSCLIHEQGVVHTAGPWRSLEETNDYAHDWEFVSRLLAAGEPWAATTRPTLNYNTETCSQPEFLRARGGNRSRHS